MTKEELNEADMCELMEVFRGNQKYHSFEGARGVSNLEELISTIDPQYKYNGIGVSTLHNFLEDNSGCIEAIHEWIENSNIHEWKEALKEVVPINVSTLHNSNIHEWKEVLKEVVPINEWKTKENLIHHANHR